MSNEPENELAYTIESFDSLLDNMNENTNLDCNYRGFDDKNFNLENDYFDDFSKISTKFKPSKIFYFISNFIVTLLQVLSIFFLILAMILLIIEIAFSYYSVIIINYVFFISSIISYGMAPIYKSLSGDWINMVMSFAQVILASPLISFYIYFILKSVISLVEFFSEVPNIVKNIFSLNKLFSKDVINEFLSTSSLGCKCSDIFTFIACLLVCGVFVGLGYALFFFDKTIIILGAIQYVAIVIQIFLLAFPSYGYFFQTIFGGKCRKNEFIETVIEFISDLVDSLNDTLNDDDDINKSKENVEDSNQKNEEKQENPKRIIDDPLISELKDDDINLIDKMNSILIIVKLLFADDYFSLYYYSTSIAFDRHKQYRKRIVMLVFFILNLIVIFYDVYIVAKDYSDYLLSSIIIRFLLIPFFSYYNMITVLYHKAKDKTLRIVNYVSVLFTAIIVIVVVFGSIYSHIYHKKYRIHDLEYFPPLTNITIANERLISHPICSQNTLNISAFDAFGYALGGFDIKRDKKIFDNQMKIFFGENYSSHISYSIHDVDKNFFFIKFYDSATDNHIYAFRGYSSGPEIAFQFELIVSYYIIPFFDDIIPLYELINENWIGFYTNFFHSFGIRFFDNRNLIVKYANSIIDIYNKENYDDNANVIFTGINCGGVIAKIVGTLVYRQSISFLSFPMDMEFLEHLFHFSTTYMSLVTNVFNIDGIFSHPDSDHTVNIGIDIPVFYKSKFCTADMCDIFSKADNIYRTFCTMSETCGRGNQFNYYCKKTIGENNINIIRKSLKEND